MAPRTTEWLQKRPWEAPAKGLAWYAAILNYLRHGELPQLSTRETDNVGREACRTGMATLEGLCMPEPQSSQQFV